MKNSHRFFENKNCQYYPCHKGMKKLNCLFCFCPLYNANNLDCIFRKIIYGGCKNCKFPHKSENYKKIMKMLKDEKI